MADLFNLINQRKYSEFLEEAQPDSVDDPVRLLKHVLSSAYHDVSSRCYRKPIPSDPKIQIYRKILDLWGRKILEKNGLNWLHDIDLLDLLPEYFQQDEIEKWIAKDDFASFKEMLERFYLFFSYTDKRCEKARVMSFYIKYLPQEQINTIFLYLHRYLEDIKTIRVALEAGADINLTSRNKTQTYFAEYVGSNYGSHNNEKRFYQACQLMLQNGADPDSIIDSGQIVSLFGNKKMSPLHFFLIEGKKSFFMSEEQYLNLIKLFLKFKANPNLMYHDESEDKIYHPLNLTKCSKIVKLLLEHRANPNGKGVLYYALSNQSAEILNLLLEAGGSLDPKSPAMQNPNEKEESESSLEHPFFLAKGSCLESDQDQKEKIKLALAWGVPLKGKYHLGEFDMDGYWYVNNDAEIRDLLDDYIKGLRARVREQQKAKLCVICAENARSKAFLPCGHFAICEECSENPLDSCPMCRQKYDSLVTIYNS